MLAYAPFRTGKYDTSPGLSHFTVTPGDPARRLLQIDRDWPRYRANKQACLLAAPEAYRQEQDLPPATRNAACECLIQQLCASYGDFFVLEAPGRLHCRLSGETLIFAADGRLLAPAGYTDLWDALAGQIQEDLAIWQLAAERDWLAALHVCAPNGWNPAEKIGLNFDRVHAEVPGMAGQRARYLPLLQGLIRKPAFERFVWDLRADDALDHHPRHGPRPAFDPGQPQLWVRLERQVLYGLPAVNAVLFTIRSYRYAVAELDSASLQGLAAALAGMSPELLAYKRLTQREALRAWLQECRHRASESERRNPGTRKPDC